MDYIQQGFKSLHEWWRYLIGLVIVFIAWQFIGVIPLAVVLVVKSPSIQEIPQEIPEIIALTGKNLFFFLALFMFLLGLLGLFFASKVLHKQPLRTLTTARPKIDWKRFWFIFILWGVISSGFLLIEYFIEPQNYIFNFKLIPFLILSVIAIILVPIQASFEEYLFRGYLMQGLGIILRNRWLPLIITSVSFGLLHGANPEVDKFGLIIMIYYIGTGFFLGIITLMDEGLELALGFHAANNLFTVLLVTTDWAAFQTHSILKDISEPDKMGIMEIFIPIFVVLPILVFILSKKYKWTNWKDRLLGNVTPPPKEDYKILD